jgi:hypothetical protein
MLLQRSSEIDTNKDQMMREAWQYHEQRSNERGSLVRRRGQEGFSQLIFVHDICHASLSLDPISSSVLLNVATAANAECRFSCLLTGFLSYRLAWRRRRRNQQH